MQEGLTMMIFRLFLLMILLDAGLISAGYHLQLPVCI
jgi:hypothetical protein